MTKRKEGFNSLFTGKELPNIKEEKKQKKLHCMIDEELKKELDIYAIKNSMNIKDVVEEAIKEYLLSKKTLLCGEI